MASWRRQLVVIAIVLALAACTRTDAPTAAGGEAARIDEVRTAIEQGFYDDARAKLAELFAAGCTQPQAQYLQAQLLAQQGDFEGAVPWCDRAIAGSPRWDRPRVLLARCYIQLKRYAAAATVFEDIDHLAPWSPWGPAGLGWVALLQNRPDDAAKLFDRALDRDGDHLPSLEMRIPIARAAGDTDLEQRLLERYDRILGGSGQAQVRLAEIAAARGLPEDARRHYERAWQLEPRPDTAKALAELARRQGDDSEAARWQQRAGLPPSAPAKTKPRAID